MRKRKPVKSSTKLSDFKAKPKTVEKKFNPPKGEERKKIVLQKLQKLGEDIYSKLENREFPYLKIPSRSTKNIIYDPKLRQFVLGERFFIRSAKNIRHLRPLTQLVWVAYTANMLCRMDKTSTLRDIYYMSQADGIDFNDQQESDEVITELETVLGVAREEFNIFPEERSAIFGDLTIEYTVRDYKGVRVNLTMH
ncbi:MAG: hypothetical protein QXG56_06010, partial [Candidatus Bathyarchaeia archaeon]